MNYLLLVLVLMLVLVSANVQAQTSVCKADNGNDGQVDFGDFIWFAQEFGRSLYSSPRCETRLCPPRQECPPDLTQALMGCQATLQDSVNMLTKVRRYLDGVIEERDGFEETLRTIRAHRRLYKADLLLWEIFKYPEHLDRFKANPCEWLENRTIGNRDGYRVFLPFTYDTLAMIWATGLLNQTQVRAILEEYAGKTLIEEGDYYLGRAGTNHVLGRFGCR